MEPSTYAIMIASNLCIYAMFANFFYKTAAPRPGWRGHWLTCYGLLAVYCFGVMLFYSSFYIKMLINILVLVSVIKFCFNVKLSTSLLLASLSFLSILTAEIIVVPLFITFTDNNTYQKILETIPVHITLSCIDILLVFVFMQLSAIAFKRNHFLRQKKMARFALLPASQYFCMFAIFISIIPNRSGPILEHNIMLGAFTFILFLIADIIIVGSVPHVIAASKQEEIKRITDLELSQLRQRYMQLERQQNELRKLRHDMVNHLATIRAFLSQGDYQAAESYSVLLNKQIKEV